MTTSKPMQLFVTAGATTQTTCRKLLQYGRYGHGTGMAFHRSAAETYLYGVLVREEVDDLEGVLDDASRHQLLTAVASLAHQRAAEALHDGALENNKNRKISAP